MSYILDALQRADAERARGSVPTLHARPAPGTASPPRTGGKKMVWLTVAGALALGATATGLWMSMWRTPSAPPPAPVAPSTVAPSPAPVPMPASAPTPRTTLPPAVPSVPGPAPRAASSAGAKVPTPASSAVVQATPPMAPLLGELPEDIRRQIPALTITGAVYSDNPAQRLLLVNGQVLTQGSPVAPDVTLVEINSGHSEFTFRGTHFRVAH